MTGAFGVSGERKAVTGASGSLIRVSGIAKYGGNKFSNKLYVS
jgi:hypothetical protein